MKTKSLTKVTLLTIFVMSVITAVTLNSCQKEIIKPKATTKAGSSKLTDPMNLTNLVLGNFNNMVFSSKKTTKGLFPNVYAFDSSSCASVVFDTVSKPHTQTYTYTPGCVGTDGRTRSGVVILSYGVQDIRTVNNVISVTYQDYKVDSLIVNGTVSYSNTGYNGNGNLVITQTGILVIDQTSEGDTLNFGFNYEWLAGANTYPAANLQFGITGQVTGTNNLGQTASTAVTSPLIRNSKTPGCNYIIQGTVRSQYPGTIMDTDFGNPGGCSGLKTVTTNGVTSLDHQ